MQDTYRITALEDKYFRVPWYVEVASGTTGTITPPTGGTIVLNQWSGSVSAKSSTITVSEMPTGIPAKTAAGADITVTLSVTGAWALSGTPSSYPIAILYYYDVKLFNFNRAYSLSTGVTQNNLTLLAGSITGDIIRYNTVTSAWEVKSEPFVFSQIVLTPAAAAVLDIEGGIWYKSTDKSVYVCTAAA